MQRTIKYSIVFPLVVIVLYANLFCNHKTLNDNREGVNSYASLNDTVKYIGMNACKQCHPGIYNTFIETGMGKSFDIASHKKTSAKFEHPLIYDKYKDLYYFAHWNNDSLKFTEFRLEGKDTIHKRTETISYIIGSGQHTNSHIFNVNGYLDQAPMTFYTQKGHWDFPPGFESGFNSRFDRKIGLECITCHNGYPEFELGSENKYSFVANGIDCERCHGPGEAHLRHVQHETPVDTSKYIDYTIVNPAKLAINLQFDICQRCHIQGNAILNKGKSFFDFRPGMQLSEVMNVFMPLYKGQEQEHIMASHAERLKMSQCYIRTTEKIVENSASSQLLKPYKNALTCVTCHNPHVSVRQTGSEIFNNACTNCHGNTVHNVCTEEPAKLAKAGNNCVSCHMRKSGSIDIPHVRVTDHYISKPLPEEKIKEVKEFIGIACINNPNSDDKTRGRAYISYFERFSFEKFALDSAKKYFRDDDEKSIRENFDELVHISFLREDYRQIISYVNAVPGILSSLIKKSYSNDDAWTCYRTGEAFYNSGDAQRALPFYERAVSLAPFALDFQNKYGTLLIDMEDLEKSKKVFEFITSQNPEYPQGWCNLGYLKLVSDKDTAAARQYYERAVALNPDYEQAILNKAGLYAYRGKFDDAKKILTAYIKRHPKSDKAKSILQSMISNAM